jgi:peptide chain release factor 2
MQIMENHAQSLKALSARIATIGEYLHVDEKRGRLSELEQQAARPDFWDDNVKAQETMSKVAGLREELSQYDAATAALEDAEVANELALESDDKELAAEVSDALEKLSSDADALELASWFDGELDAGDAIITINPGQGGLEAQDWTEMLFRMYSRYVERKGWKMTVNDIQTGEGIGLDRVTFTVSGHNAYGMLTSERGVHRLVRISPTDDKKRRQTTFGGVEVLPVISEEVEVDLDPNDIRVDVYHSSGHGGQGVNTTDSAVRLTHLPTGIVVTCQNERSQIQNKATAMGILRSKLYELELEKRESELEELTGPKHEISFGSQIRNYVLYPYQLVKDLRSGIETSNVDAVLDGDIDEFVVGYHRWRVSNS